MKQLLARYIFDLEGILLIFINSATFNLWIFVIIEMINSSSVPVLFSLYKRQYLTDIIPILWTFFTV